MKISVITIAYNAEETIEETIQSVLSQDYDSVEYIIIDGASKDRTQAIIEQYRDKIDTVISEPDLGIYDAMNKGLKLATGDLIALLNADDTYASAGVLSAIASLVISKKVDACYGDLEYVSRRDPSRVIRKWISGDFKKSNFLQGWMPPHPAFFAKQSLYEEFGYFNTTLKTSADYELMLRFLFRYGVSVSYLPKVLVKMKMGGQSNQSIQNRLEANKEDRMAWKINGLNPGTLTFIKKPLRKLSQYWKR